MTIYEKYEYFNIHKIADIIFDYIKTLPIDLTNIEINSSNMSIIIWIDNNQYRDDLFSCSLISINFITGNIDSNLDGNSDDRLQIIYDELIKYKKFIKVGKLISKIQKERVRIYNEKYKFLKENIKIGTIIDDAHNSWRVIYIGEEFITLLRNKERSESKRISDIVNNFLYERYIFNKSYIRNLKLKQL